MHSLSDHLWFEEESLPQVALNFTISFKLSTQMIFFILWQSKTFFYKQTDSLRARNKLSSDGNESLCVAIDKRRTQTQILSCRTF